MARSPTTSDAFNAVAEPQRRKILALLARGEQSVNCVAASLSCTQPQVSKHLKVLKTVGLVSVRTCGKQRLYKLEGSGLKPIHDWVSGFEQFWNDSFDRLAQYLAQIQAKQLPAASGESPTD